MAFVLAALVTTAGAAAQTDSAGETPQLLTCESQNGGREHCDADTSRGVALGTQTGSEACLLGKNWGYDDKGVWVADGCSADFVIGQTETGAYAEFRIDDSASPEGEDSVGAGVLGLKYRFSWKASHRS